MRSYFSISERNFMLGPLFRNPYFVSVVAVAVVQIVAIEYTLYRYRIR